MSKRKRRKSFHVKPRKRAKPDLPGETPQQGGQHVLQPLLHHCYCAVKTLRTYLLDALPSTSRHRRRQLLTSAGSDSQVDRLLDNTLVGLLSPQQLVVDVQLSRTRQFLEFTQTQTAAQSACRSSQSYSLEHVVDFVVLTLFRQHQGPAKKPNHLLCHGLQKSVTTAVAGTDPCKLILPGIIQRCTNPYHTIFKQQIWQEAISLVGADAEITFISLLMDCGIFLKLGGGKASYQQISGILIHDVPKNNLHVLSEPQDDQQGRHVPTRKPGSIAIVRSRVLYGQPNLKRYGNIQFGFKHMHVLNRYSDLGDQEQDLILLRYIFPRQFGLHNVFESHVDRTETVQAFKDYTVREDEADRGADGKYTRIPKRLRGPALSLVRRIRRNHTRCSFEQLIAHYCSLGSKSSKIARQTVVRMPQQSQKCAKNNGQLLAQVKSIIPSLRSPDALTGLENNEDYSTSLLPHATSADKVSSFCQAALRRLLPADTFGSSDDGHHNWLWLVSYVHRFVHMRKFETCSLHELAQSLRITSITWLVPAGTQVEQKLSATDKTKREEIFNELLYYIFDSLLIPLIHSNFYVTESGTHRNKLLYFRHDVWRRLCQPSLESAKLGPLISISTRQARLKSGENGLGFSVVRLVPKESGVRSIANLRRRTLKVVNGKRVLAPSINTRLTPVFNIFNLERVGDTGTFKLDTFSTQDLQNKLAAFKSSMAFLEDQPLFFVKVDIKSAFDSIPQKKLLHIVERLFKHEQYHLVKHVEGKLLGKSGPSLTAKPMFRFMKAAIAADVSKVCPELQSTIHHAKNYTVFSNIDHFQTTSKCQAQALLHEHVEANLIKIGNKYYRQSEGIPQGSILSSLLCTFFYNDFEIKRLNFLRPDSSTLLRIIDDFLLITTNEREARRFVEAMKAGDASYGIQVHPEKSLVNFDMTIAGVRVPKLPHSTSFPYCGLYIDTKTLRVSKDRVRKDNDITNSLTVDLHGRAGEKFKRRLLASLRIQLQGILLDDRLNDRARVLRSLLECLQETTMKMHQYYVSMPLASRPSQQLLIQVVEQLRSLVSGMVGGKEGMNNVTFTRTQVSFLTAAAVLRVLDTRQTRYAEVIGWLRKIKEETQHSLNMDPRDSDLLVAKAFEAVRHYRY